MASQKLLDAFATRLHEVLTEAGVTTKKTERNRILGSKVGVSKEAARKWTEGIGLPELERAIDIASAYDVCTEWLLTGCGPKRPAAPSDPDNPLSDIARRYKSSDIETQVIVDVALGIATRHPMAKGGLDSLRPMLDGLRHVVSNSLTP